jgi:hypothetical protein
MCSITLILEQKVIGVVMTSSPVPMPRIDRATWRPAVHEFRATASDTPIELPKPCSNLFVLGPVVIYSDLSVLSTSEYSSSDKAGGEKDR